MQEIIIISLVIAVVLVIVFWKRKNTNEISDYQEPSYHPSGKEWVFNGILDIENPPSDNSCLINYKERIQLMTRKGYMLYEMQINQNHLSHDDVGLYDVEVKKLSEQSVSISHKGKVIGQVNTPPVWLLNKMTKNNHIKAYAFIACGKNKDGDEYYYGDVCIEK